MYSRNLFQQAALRHARYYVEQLKTAENLYQKGGGQARAGLALFDQHLSQVKQAQTWLESQMEQDDQAALCCQIPIAGRNILPMRLPLVERLHWLQTAYYAALRLNEFEIVRTHLILIGHIYVDQGRHAEAQESYQRALEMAEEAKDRRIQADALLGVGRIISMTPARMEEAQSLVERARDIYRDLNDLRSYAWAVQNMGNIAERQGNYAEATAYVDDALAIFQQLGIPNMISSALKRRAAICEREEDYEGGIRYISQAVQIAREIQDSNLLAQSLQIQGLILSNQGNNATALHIFEESLELSIKVGNRHLIAIALSNLAWIANYLGDHRLARGYYLDILEMYQQMQMWLDAAGIEGQLAFTALRLYDLPDAERFLHSGWQHAHDLGAKTELYPLLLGFVWLFLEKGIFADAVRYLGVILADPQSITVDDRYILEQVERRIRSETENDLDYWIAEGKTVDILKLPMPLIC